ncbi:hypothetical protein QP921_06600 [Corynebacterium pseudodiphtheriticum]|nr:hypothetical protein [Corynebacterium pseudodiphtheriticum]MDK8479083.1 hypothetical protein [Corynebacterium pseudodiphtheriticum]MDK8486534.1 hypothetical protein [Corynebacterium pseudodiphtheriticum]MDK8493953.1 hypothetical protein [Corynebacterium pseudodiphtheriticum]MDK8551749.1 hypothetical protein [Corynebacterium pseudodiphtheriticum]MDK8564066.1 hypothetical protein [Corynebacterium pseudodiphtheriticum]
MARLPYSSANIFRAVVFEGPFLTVTATALDAVYRMLRDGLKVAV